MADSVAILDEHRDGDTWTWTVEAELPGLKGEADGQLNLFAVTPTDYDDRII